MSLSALLGALASQTRHAAVMVDETQGFRAGFCAHKAELFRLAADGFAQAAALETESTKAAARYQDKAARAAADAAFWSRHADHWLELEAAAFEPA
jgi:hypothetical protein